MTKIEAQEVYSKVRALRDKDPTLNNEKACAQLGFHFTKFYRAQAILEIPGKSAKYRADSLEKVKQIEALVAQGVTKKAACAQAGLPYSSYAYYKSDRSKPGEKPADPEPSRVHRGNWKTGTGFMYRMGLQPHTLADGRLAVNCSICQWEVRGKDPNNLNQCVTRHYRAKHPVEYRNPVALPVPAVVPQRQLVLEAEPVLDESFACPTCGHRVSVTEALEAVKTLRQQNQNNNSHE